MFIAYNSDYGEAGLFEEHLFWDGTQENTSARPKNDVDFFFENGLACTWLLMLEHVSLD
jgi:hypothetical protein